MNESITAKMIHRTSLGGDTVSETEIVPVGGLTIRDWFAGMALNHVPDLIAANERNRSINAIAEWSYQIADSMIAERERRGS